MWDLKLCRRNILHSQFSIYSSIRSTYPIQFAIQTYFRIKNVKLNLRCIRKRFRIFSTLRHTHKKRNIYKKGKGKKLCIFYWFMFNRTTWPERWQRPERPSKHRKPEGKDHFAHCNCHPRSNGRSYSRDFSFLEIDRNLSLWGPIFIVLQGARAKLRHLSIVLHSQLLR